MLQTPSLETHVDHAPTWAHSPDNRTASDSRTDWRAVDQTLRSIAQRRASLDADEARWLREAERLRIWRPLGMVSAIDYMERVLGYAPRAAQDRLRVARALGDLPVLESALSSGELSFSALRELTRVATRATESAWARAAAGKNLREIEELVAGHRPGDLPEDPRDPEVRMHWVRFEVSPETFARLRQAQQVLDAEHGARLSDDQLVAALCDNVLDGPPTGRARYQVSVVVCERCRQGWQHGAGAKLPIDAGAVERAECDAQHVTERGASQDVAPRVARFVWARDGGHCRVPGCRSSRGLEIHHLKHRADGGGHDPSNLCLVCSACHQAHHAGTLTIRGTVDHIEIDRPGAHVGAPGEIEDS